MVTVSEFVTIIEISEHRNVNIFLRDDDFMVASLVQIIGLTMCLHALAVVYRASDYVGAVASEWHIDFTLREATRVEGNSGNGAKKDEREAIDE
ncbi:hypothetical protein QJS10_CPA16g00436 [Acorus calamus]|uniref:Uncharacterized protein n=1 Tax=Acorus calamus TaxID=4465 RepID=A0AAV9CYP0_ACOCL|nr:hypothetical protein QJS10_CPA16g00436 [Acorus calamus]